MRATYVFVYTPLKRRSSINTLVGAIPGALPPMIGWVGGGGAMEDPRGWFLFALLFLWQLPHFVSVNWLCREQYETASFRMWSDGDESGRRSGFLDALRGNLASLRASAKGEGVEHPTEDAAAPHDEGEALQMDAPAAVPVYKAVRVGKKDEIFRRKPSEKRVGI